MGRLLLCTLFFVVVASLAAGEGSKPKTVPHITTKKNHVAETHKVATSTSTKSNSNPAESTESAEQAAQPELRTNLVQSQISADTKAELEEARLAPAVLPHFPMLAPHLVEHLTGLTQAPAQASSGPRSIIVTPSFGPTSGGVWVQIVGAGSYYTPNSLQCKLDLVEQYCYSNHYYYSWCYITPKCAGVYPVKCHNGPLQFEGKYAVVAKVPWVTSVYPFSGDTSGGTAVTVRGWNFEPHCPKNLLCKFGEYIVPAKFYTSSSVMCIAPCAADKGFVSVEVSNDGGMHWSMSGVQYGYVGDKTDLSTQDCQRYLSPITKTQAQTAH